MTERGGLDPPCSTITGKRLARAGRRPPPQPPLRAGCAERDRPARSFERGAALHEKESYFDLYKDKNLRPPVRGDWDDKAMLEKRGMVFNSCTGPRDPELIRQQQVGYYACITHVDHQIGRILQALIEHKLMDNTVILFTSDHGEMLSDHGWCRKSLPYNGSAHIPMFISGPERFIGPRGRVDNSLVELRDVMPTLLDLAGAPVPKHLDGQSMLRPVERDYLHGEHLIPGRTPVNCLSNATLPNC